MSGSEKCCKEIQSRISGWSVTRVEGEDITPLKSDEMVVGKGLFEQRSQ